MIDFLKIFRKPIEVIKPVIDIDVLKQNIKGILIELEDIGYMVEFERVSSWRWIGKDLFIISIIANYESVKFIEMYDPTCKSIFEMLFEYVHQNDFVLREIKYTEKISKSTSISYYKFSDTYCDFNTGSSYDSFSHILKNKKLSSIILDFTLSI